MKTSKETIEYQDLTPDELLQKALDHEEGVLSQNGAIAVQTGKRTGRSPKDRFIVKDDLTASTISWGEVNQPVTSAVFAALWNKVSDYLYARTHYVSHHRVGADSQHFLPVKVVTELAWHNLFVHHMFIDGGEDYCEGKTPWTLLCAPQFLAQPERDGTYSEAALMIDFSEQRVLLCGLPYAGEMKKAMFSILNYLLPKEGVLPMHCAANQGEAGDVAVFFGLSGTGKTTLSSDPLRYMIGDDEHGWNQHGVFNFEGGCYAKCIDLSQRSEPVIWNAIRHGAVMENVVLNKATQQPDFHDRNLTENTRAAYPREHIAKRIVENRGGQPQAVLFLACDCYGVLPPIAVLTREQAAYYFLSGYTALVGSTQLGSGSGIKATFSACFGAPFFPRDPTIYANLLLKRLDENPSCRVYLINTGWIGGALEEGGKRIDIDSTRQIVRAAISGELNSVALEALPGFGFMIPNALRGVDAQILNPRTLWPNTAAYDRKAHNLITQFQQNFEKFAVAPEIREAGPQQY